MDAQQLVSEFLASEHGVQAAQALSAQGVGAADAQQLLSQAATAGVAHAEEQHAGLLGEHAGKSFFAAFASGLVRGDGFFKSLVDGGEGVITGRIAESMAAGSSVSRLVTATSVGDSPPSSVSTTYQ